LKLRALFLCALTFSVCAFAQEFRGSISGAVTDASGAAIAAAKVNVVEISTGTKFEAVSDTEGHYLAPSLLPGDYQLTVQAAGFKEMVRKGIHVAAGERPILDVQLQVGDAATTVEVTADAPLITSDSASVGQTITTKEIEDLPSNGGTPMMSASLSMGVISTGQPSTVQPFASGGGASWSIAGTPSQTNEILIDGAPDTTWDGRLAYSPPQDAVREVRVKAFDTDSGYGHTGGGTANQILKSGTNRVNGTLYWKNQPNNLVANNFFNNKSGLKPAVTHYNQASATIGGPLYIPKVFDGRNKVFWFFAFEDDQASSPAPTFVTVPTDAERQGDFSALLKIKSPTILYDPFTAVLNGTTVTRTALPNNRIPAAYMSPIAQKLLGLFPAPNVVNVTRDDGFQNYGNNGISKDGFTNELGRLDMNLSDKHRVYFNARHTDYSQTKNDYFGNIATGSFLSRANDGATFDDVYLLNATNIFNIRANFTRMFEDHASPSAGVNPSDFGFPALLGANSQYLQLPVIAFAGNSGFQQLGSNGANGLPSQSAQLYGTWTAVRGSHQIKMGVDARQYNLNYKSYGNATGNFSFSNNNWVRSASNASATVALGQDFAEFLMGLPTSGSYDQNASGMFYQHYIAGFVQDDWRVSRTLSLNLGLRFDRDFPYHEKWGRTVNGFASDTPSPIAAAAMAAYAASPISLLPVSAFKVNGGLTFATPENNAIYRQTSHLFSPRFGLAWTPEKLHGKTVLRGGIAMFASPNSISTLQITGAYSTNPILTQEGFSQSTAMTTTTDSNLTAAATLANPFPAGIQKPVGAANGLMTFVGQTVNIINPEMKNPYAIRWNIGIQHEITKNTILEIVYMGNHGVHLPITYTQLNGLPRSVLSTSPVRDQATITALTASVPNPFRGLVTSGTPAGTTTTVAQLLARFPQFPLGYSNGTYSGSGGVYMQDVNGGSSYYNALNVRLERRLSNGLSARFIYMHSKLIDATTWLNDTDAAPEHRISPFDHPHRFVTTLRYELPVGKGKLLNIQSPLLQKIAGNWVTSSTYTFQTGAPLTWVNGSTSTPGDYVYFGGALSPDNRNTDGLAFNTKAFDTLAADQLQYHIRTFSSTFPNVRQDGINDWNVSLLKEVRFGSESRRLFRVQCDVFNVINHATFAAPNTTATNTGFGQITAQSNRPRLFQLAARFVF
jgi:hypothetical protein